MTSKSKVETMRGVVFGASLFAVVYAAADGAQTISIADWQRVQTGAAVLQIPALQRAVAELRDAAQKRIIVRYPGGDSGNQWAIDLRDWLVALGIPLKQILLEPGSGVPDAIVIATDDGGL